MLRYSRAMIERTQTCGRRIKGQMGRIIRYLAETKVIDRDLFAKYVAITNVRTCIHRKGMSCQNNYLFFEFYSINVYVRPFMIGVYINLDNT